MAKAPAEPTNTLVIPKGADTVLEAHLRREANWEKDAKDNPAFAGPDAAQRRREKIVEEVDALTLKAKREQADADAKKNAVQAKADAAARAAELRAEADALSDKVNDLMAEAERLDKVAKG